MKNLLKYCTPLLKVGALEAKAPLSAKEAKELSIVGKWFRVSKELEDVLSQVEAACKYGGTTVSLDRRICKATVNELIELGYALEEYKIVHSPVKYYEVSWGDTNESK